MAFDGLGNLYLYPGNGSSIDRCAVPDCTGLSAVVTPAQARALAVDSQNLYWTDGIDGEVRELSLSSHALTTIDTPPSPPVGLVINASAVFWTEGSSVRTSNLSGVGAQTLETIPRGCPTRLALDSSALYWLDPCLQAIYMLPLCGSPLQTLWNQGPGGGSGAPGDLAGLAVDDTNVYWTDPAHQQVLSMPK
jgi:hypothetical protein